MSNSKDIIIFDSLAHPMLEQPNAAKWDYSFADLAKQMNSTQVKYACAVGLPNEGNYSNEAYIRECKKYPTLVPVAAFTQGDIDTQLDLIINLGYKAVKLIPALAKIDINSNTVNEIFSACEKRNFPLFFCTYNYACSNYSNQFGRLWELVTTHPKLKLLLVHGGCVEVLKYSELVRNNSNLILDLSFTMLKYKGSSIDADIQFLFNKFDRRICIGSDHPEFDLAELENCFINHAEGLSKEKQQNIAYKNLQNFLGLNDDFFE